MGPSWETTKPNVIGWAAKNLAAELCLIPSPERSKGSPPPPNPSGPTTMVQPFKSGASSLAPLIERNDSLRWLHEIGIVAPNSSSATRSDSTAFAMALASNRSHSSPTFSGFRLCFFEAYRDSFNIAVGQPLRACIGELLGHRLCSPNVNVKDAVT